MLTPRSGGGGPARRPVPPPFRPMEEQGRHASMNGSAPRNVSSGRIGRPSPPVPQPHHAVPSRVLVQQKRAQLIRLEEERQREHQTFLRMQDLVKSFKERSILAKESILQAHAIQALVEQAASSVGRQRDERSDDEASSVDSDEGAEFREDEIARARAVVLKSDPSAASPEGSDQLSALEIATVLSERRAAKTARKLATSHARSTDKFNASRDKSVQHIGGEGSIKILYAPGVQDGMLDDQEDVNAIADELEREVTTQDESRKIQNMVLAFQCKERPVPPGFDSTSLSSEMELIAREANDAMLSAEDMLRYIMDPTGRSFVPGIFEGEIARLQYRLEVLTTWLTVAGDHAKRYVTGATAIQTGVSSEVNLLRKSVLEEKESCDLLGRQCERKKVECEVAARKHESQVASAVLRQVLTRKHHHTGGTLPRKEVKAADADSGAIVEHGAATASPMGLERGNSNVQDLVPRVPKKHLRAAMSRLRHNLTAAQSTLYRSTDSKGPAGSNDDERILKALDAVIRTLKQHEDEHRDEVGGSEFSVSLIADGKYAQGTFSSRLKDIALEQSMAATRASPKATPSAPLGRRGTMSITERELAQNRGGANQIMMTPARQPLGEDDASPPPVHPALHDIGVDVDDDSDGEIELGDEDLVLSAASLKAFASVSAFTRRTSNASKASGTSPSQSPTQQAL